MKKIKLKNIYFLIIISSVLLIPFLIGISYSKADDESERDNFQQPEPQEVAPTPSPIITPQQFIAPKETNTVINRETLATVSDNSAVLAALEDSDKDGIPDIIDKHPGEDDFAYSLIDNNNNGIADNLEILLK